MLPTTFPDKEFIATTTAKMLLEVEAIHFRADEPYMFTSGWASPVAQGQTPVFEDLLTDSGQTAGQWGSGAWSSATISGLSRSITPR